MHPTFDSALERPAKKSIKSWHALNMRSTFHCFTHKVSRGTRPLAISMLHIISSSPSSITKRVTFNCCERFSLKSEFVIWNNQIIPWNLWLEGVIDPNIRLVELGKWRCWVTTFIKPRSNLFWLIHGWLAGGFLFKAGNYGHRKSVIYKLPYLYLHTHCSASFDKFE